MNRPVLDLPAGFVIKGSLPGLNEYVKAVNRSRYAGAALKKQEQAAVIWQMVGIKNCVIERPVKIRFAWVEKDRRRDLDNIAYAKKIILDAMVECGVLADDGRRYVRGFEDVFPEPDKGDPRIEITIMEAD